MKETLNLMSPPSETAARQTETAEERTEMAVRQAEKAAGPDLSRGLTEEQVRRAVSEGRVNRLPESSAKTEKEIVRENILTYFNGIFLLLSLLLIAARSFRSLTFLPVIVINTLIGIVQEIHAKHVLDRLNVLSQARASVIRDGEEIRVPVEDLVQEDVVRIHAGDQIPADGYLISGTISVNEALLTGEADEIEKTPGSGKDSLKSGSFVTAGEGLCVLTGVGKDSYVSRLTLRAKEMNGSEQSEMVRDINLLVLIAGILIIPIGITLFFQSFFLQNNTFSDSVVSMVAAVIGMIPEGLYLLVSIALALSSVRLAASHVVLHDMRSVETLARVDVLCVDKTGTITVDDMKVTECAMADDTVTREERRKTERMIGGYLRCLSDDNSTMRALREYFRDKEPLNPEEISPFSSAHKYSEVKTAGKMYRLGAPDFVLSGRIFEENRNIVSSYAEQGQRVLVFAEKEDGTDGTEEEFRPLAFIALENRVRENIEETFQFFRTRGVQVKVLSGDDPVTVSQVAQRVKIPGASHYVDMSALQTEDEIKRAVRRYTVFGRMRPEQKKMVVKALQAQGKKVAMTGDGVNDILAMKEADCSIALGSGSEAAMQAAQVVLLDSDFAHMKQIVSEGRRNINNISRSATLFLVKNLFSLFLSVFSIVNVMTYPLQPSQISLISSFNIGIPAFFLALEQNDARQQPHFLRNVLIKAMPAALTDFLIIAAMVLFGEVFGVSQEDISVASTFLLAIVGFMILVKISSPLNQFRAAVILGCAAGFLAAAFFFSDLFAITGVSRKCILLFSLFAIATEPFMRYLTRFFEWMEKKIFSRR